MVRLPVSAVMWEIAPLTIQQVKKPFIATCVSIMIYLVELARPTGRCRGEDLAGLGPDAVTQTGDGWHARPRSLAVPV